MSISTILNRFVAAKPSPIVKQSPTILLFGVAVFMLVFAPAWVSNAPATIAGVTTAIGATVIAAVLSSKRGGERFGLVVPALDILAIGLLRFGTGESVSIFTALLILPIIWFASEDGREYIWFAFVGTAVVLLFPSVAGASDSTTAAALLRAGFTAAVFTVAAAVINELSRQARLRLHSVRQLAEERKSALDTQLEQTAEIAASEARMHRHERLFRGLWEAVTEQSVIGTDVTGLIDAWNPGAEKMFGITAEDVQDKLHVDGFHLADELEERARELNYPAGATVLNPGFSALVEPARLGSADSREWTYIRPDGVEIPVQLSVTARLGDQGETVGYLFVANDLTQAQEVAKLKDDFVGLISHELRTPLSSVLGYLELMRDDDDDKLSDTQLQYLEVAERNANRLLTLVGDLLFTAQVESGKFNLEQHVQSLAPIVTAAVDSARPAAAAAGVTLLAEVVACPMVRGDSVRLGQACDNLISNAIKFTPRGGTITVAMSDMSMNDSFMDDADSRVKVSVTDTGMGIAASELDMLFTKFFRATTATRNAVPGVGLGLAITRAIVTAHGGAMAVRSEEGVGTEFSLTLPVVQHALV